MFTNFGLGEHVIRSHAFAAVPTDSRLIDYRLLRLAVQRNETHRIGQIIIDRGFGVNPDATRHEFADSPLHFAMERRNGKVLRLLMKHYASVEQKNKYGLTALQTADNLGNFTAVDMIIPELEYRDYLERLIKVDNLSTMHSACQRGDVEAINRMLERRLIIEKPFPLSSPIGPGCRNPHLAIVSRSMKLVELLILRGIERKTKNILNLTALQLAAKTGNKILVRQLLRLYIDHEVDVAVEYTDGMTYLHHACTLDKDSLDIILAFLKKGANVHATTSLALSDVPGYTPLHFAVKNGNLSNVQELMDCGADPTVKNGHGETPLHLTEGDLDIVETCFKNYKHYDVDSRDRYGTSHFQIACLFAQFEIVNEFLKLGTVADINTRIKMTPALSAYHGSTPLQLALRLDSSARAARSYSYQPVKVVRRLLQSPDIDVNVRDSCGLTALHIAVMTVVKPATIWALIDHDRTDVNAPDLGGQTALHLAAKSKKRRGPIESLIWCSGDMYAQDGRGRTPLHVAHEHHLDTLLFSISRKEIYERNPCDCDGISVFDIACDNYPSGGGVIEWFLQKGLISDKAAMRGLSRAIARTNAILHTAVRKAYTTTVRALLRLGLVDANITNNMGATALHVVASRPMYFRLVDYRIIAQILIDAGINMEARILDTKRTALHQAVVHKFHSIVEFLLKHGASISAKDACQNTPLHIAVMFSDMQDVEILIDAGADVNERDERGAIPLHKVPQRRFIQSAWDNDEFFSELPVEWYSQFINALLYAPTSHGNIDAMDKIRMTPLCIAVKKDLANCTKAFLERGADPEYVWHRLIMRFAPGNSRRQNSIRVVSEQLIRLRVARLLKHKKSANLHLDFGMVDGAQAALEQDCHNELARMMEVYIDPYTTLRDLLYKSDIAFRPHLANDHLKKILGDSIDVDQNTYPNKKMRPLFLDKHPNYGPMVCNTYRRALLRLELMQEAIKAIEAIWLHVIPEESVARVVPEPCIETILGMVNDKGMRNLVEAVYHKKLT